MQSSSQFKSDSEQFLSHAVRFNMYGSERRLRAHLRYIFGNEPLNNTSLLDVGGGKGLLTLFAASCGANAICLEPEADGSSEGMVDSFAELRKAVPHVRERATILNCSFQDYCTDHLFHTIVLANSINHLNEEACVRLKTCSQARDTYKEYFIKIYKMLHPGGRVIITDCSRTNFFDCIGLKNPMMPTIEWHKHQSPKLWCSLLKDVGFHLTNIKWSSPNSFGRLGRVLLGNRVIAFFFLSHFRIEVRKPN